MTKARVHALGDVPLALMCFAPPAFQGFLRAKFYTHEKWLLLYIVYLQEIYNHNKRLLSIISPNKMYFSSIGSGSFLGEGVIEG